MTKHREQIILKNMFFLLMSNCKLFLRILGILFRVWEALGVPKNAKELKKSCSGRFRNVIGICYRFLRIWNGFKPIWESFGMVLGGLGWVVAESWKDFEVFGADCQDPSKNEAFSVV